MLSLDEATFRALYRNLIVLFLLLSLVPLLVTGWLTFRGFDDSLHETVTENLAQLAASKSLAIENWLFEREADIQVLSGSETLIADMAALLTTPQDAPQARQCIERHLDFVREKYGCYDSFLVLDAEGEVHIGPQIGNQAREVWFTQGTRGLHTTDVFLPADAQTPAIMVCHPIVRAGNVLGVLAARVSMHKIGEIMQDARLSETGETYLVNQDGYFLTESRFAEGYPLSKRIDTYGVREALQAHRNGADEYLDYRGVKVLGAYAWMPSRAWALLAELDSAEAFGDVNHLRRYHLSISLFAAIAIVSATFWVTHNLVMRLREDSRLLRQQQEELIRSERLASIGRLAAGVAHEINNPISTISSIAQWLGKRHRADKELQVQFGTIEQQADRCAGIVQRLLDFAHPSSPEATTVDIHELLRNSLSFLKHALDRSGIVTVTQYEAPEHHVIGDPHQLMQVLINLTLNAVHAMPNGGELTISTERATNWNVQIVFSDTGMGIPAEILSSIFDPFFTTKEPGEGTGLGLAISHTIIEQHQGTIKVSSEPGTGSQFVITLPVSRKMD